MTRLAPRRALLSALATLLLIAGGLVRGSSAAPKPVADKRPNIVVILADDLGWSDLGCYGGEIRTPNLDRLAANGLRFTRFYNAGRCCPTRASLLTGLYPHQAGIGAMTFDRGLPGYRGQLRPDTPTMAEVLRRGGYRTAMSGKWHVSLTKEGPDHLRHLNNQEIADTFADPASYPRARGFERYFGCIWGVVNYFDPFSLVDGDQPVRSVPRDFYMTDAVTDRAIDYVDEFSRDRSQPFFLYLAYTAPHWPLHARPQDLARYQDTYQGGWDAVRQARYERQAKLGVLDPKQAELTPRAQSKRRWEDNPDRKFDAATMATHAAMVDRMDQGIGRLVARLKEQGQLDNTLLVFLSDNGASPESYPNGGFDRPTETRDGRKILHPGALRASGVLPGPETTFGTLGPVWASVVNTPFRLWKAQTAEGGICTPLIVHWPAKIQAKGEFRRQPGHVVDLMATALDVGGVSFPEEFGGTKTTRPEGRSLLPAFAGKPLPREEGLLFEHEGNMAVIDGDWKAVNTNGAGGRWELYNLATDRTEMHDRAAAEPERLRALVSKWNAWSDRVLVKPAPQKFRPLPGAAQ
jgi:arylsulfatase